MALLEQTSNANSTAISSIFLQLDWRKFAILFTKDVLLPNIIL